MYHWLINGSCIWIGLRSSSRRRGDVEQIVLVFFPPGVGLRSDDDDNDKRLLAQNKFLIWWYLYPFRFDSCLLLRLLLIYLFIMWHRVVLVCHLIPKAVLITFLRWMCQVGGPLVILEYDAWRPQDWKSNSNQWNGMEMQWIIRWNNWTRWLRL